MILFGSLKRATTSSSIMGDNKTALLRLGREKRGQFEPEALPEISSYSLAL
jgi:hypothetical protein